MTDLALLIARRYLDQLAAFGGTCAVLLALVGAGYCLRFAMAMAAGAQGRELAEMLSTPVLRAAPRAWAWIATVYVSTVSGTCLSLL